MTKKSNKISGLKREDLYNFPAPMRCSERLDGGEGCEIEVYIIESDVLL